MAGKALLWLSKTNNEEIAVFQALSENIGYGKPGATREEVMEAAKRAGADAFIQELKDKYDTYVGERNPPLIILDEATSALDNESEYAVAKSLNELANEMK